jgi:hypothetical protein
VDHVYGLAHLHSFPQLRGGTARIPIRLSKQVNITYKLTPYRPTLKVYPLHLLYDKENSTVFG